MHKYSTIRITNKIDATSQKETHGVAKGVYIQQKYFTHFRNRSKHGNDQLLYIVCHITHFHILQ